MVRFAHISDVHLGGWKQAEMQDLNFQSFRRTVDICLNSKLDFILIAGDLFDSAYPPIEILKETFAEFKRLKDANLPCFIIAGSHDYSVSGKTFLDVLEKAGFCRNVEKTEIKDDNIILNPTLFKGVAIYGYSGKKASLEIQELRKIKFNDSPGMFRILMLHTTIDKARGTLPIDAMETELLPEADYYALGHLHMDFRYEDFVYPGPVFPNNFQELEDLKGGSFYILDTNSEMPLQKVELKIRDVVSIKFNVTNAMTATEEIINEIDKQNVYGKIVLLRVSGELKNQKSSEIKFANIEEFAKKKGAYFVLRNTHELNSEEVELEKEIKNTDDIESETIKTYSGSNFSRFNSMIPSLINALGIDKQEGETQESFNSRLFEDTKKILSLK